MARWRGIFGRKGKREGEPDATPTGSTGAGDDPATALYPQTDPERDQLEEPDRPRGLPAMEPDTGTAEWAPPSPVDSRRRPAAADEPASAEIEVEVEEEASAEIEPEPAAPEPEESPEPEPEEAPEPEPEEAPEPEPSGSDTGERIRVAADEAAQVAEMRSHDEIVALEKNLEQAHATARAEVEEMAVRLREALTRSRQAEERADALSAARTDFEAKTREDATQWLRGQVIKLKADAQKRVREEVERIRTEAGAGSGDPGAAATADTEGLRSELKLAREEAAARIAEAREVGKREALESGGGADERIQAAREAGRAEAEAEMELDDEPHRRELEQRALAAAEARVAERIARIEADADERIRAEVSVARKAAEERFTELLSTRERDLQSEREERAAAVERSHERLEQIERQAIEAAERVGVAEQELEAEKVRLREESAAELEIAIGQAKAVADQASAERLRDREEELDDAIAAAEQSERDVQGKVDEANSRADEAEERAKSIEAEAAAAISEVRQAAADWLRDQTKAIRAEAASGSGSGPPDGSED